MTAIRIGLLVVLLATLPAIVLATQPASDMNNAHMGTLPEQLLEKGLSI